MSKLLVSSSSFLISILIISSNGTGHGFLR
jgi:hypothetical protein